MHERLIYPLVQVPLAMAEEGGDGERVNPFFKNPVMWIGFSIPAIWGMLHGLHNYFPDMLPIAQHADMFSMRLPLFGDTPPLHIILRFNILGFFYFLKTEIAFSLWFFNLFAVLQRGVFSVLGITGPETLGAGHAVHNPILAHYSMGGMLVLVLVGLWMAGLPLSAAVVLLFLALVLFVGFTHVVAEGGGVGWGVAGDSGGYSGLGGGVVRLGALWTGGLGDDLYVDGQYAFIRDGLLRQWSQVAEELGANKRPLFWAMVLALVVSLV